MSNEKKVQIGRILKALEPASRLVTTPAEAMNDRKHQGIGGEQVDQRHVSLPIAIHPSMKNDLPFWSAICGCSITELLHESEAAVRTRHRLAEVAAEACGNLPAVYSLAMDLPPTRWLHYSLEPDCVLIRGYSWHITQVPLDDRDDGWFYCDFVEPGRGIPVEALKLDSSEPDPTSPVDLNTYWGRCPTCRGSDGFRNLGRNHWFYCETHRVRWCAGENLFACWREETEEDWRKNWEFLKGFAEIKPLSE